MTKNLKWASLALYSLSLCVVNAHAAEMKGVTWSGGAVAGWQYTWKSMPNASADKLNGFLVDEANLRMDAQVSDSTKIVFSNAFSYQPTNQGAFSSSGLTPVINSSNFFNKTQLAANGMTFANQEAYIAHKCSDSVTTMVGNMSTPFGMEGMWKRSDMHSYYYSMGAILRRDNGGYGWAYDLGIKFNIVDVLPGTLEVAVMDGKERTVNSPALALRWSKELKGVDSSFMPVISAYAGNMYGGPKDIGFTGGANWKMGALWIAGELTFQQSPIGSALVADGDQPKESLFGFWIEPGFDFGMATISLKGEWGSYKPAGSLPATEAQSDINLGVALSHTYAGGYNVKLAYQHTGLSDKILRNNHINDIRLLFSTSW